MAGDSRVNQSVSERLVALFLLGALLLLPPVLLIFNVPARAVGVPVLYLYVFIAWALLIVLAAATSSSLTREDPSPGRSVNPEPIEDRGRAERATDA